MCKELGICLLNEDIRSTQIRYLSHVRRREDEHPTQMAYNYLVVGTRPTGRPRKRCFQYVDKHLKERGSFLHLVEQAKLYLDRVDWRQLHGHVIPD